MANMIIEYPLELCEATTKVAPSMEKALNSTKKVVEDLAACTNEIKIQMFFELGNGLKEIAGEEGFSKCVSAAAETMLKVVDSIKTMDMFKDDETVQAAQKKAAAAMEKVMQLADSVGKGLPAISGKTAPGASLSESNKTRLVSNTKKLSDIRKEFIMDLAGGVSKIQDIDYQNKVREQCRGIEESCNTLCGQMSKHNSALEALGMNANQLKTDVAKNFPPLNKLKGGSRTANKNMSKMRGRY